MNSKASNLGWLQHARPHLRRGALYTLLAIAALSVGSVPELRGRSVTTQDEVIAYAGAAVLLVAGVLAVRAVARAARAVTAERAGDARGAALGLVTTIFGYVLVLMAVLIVGEINISGLLLGGAITGVVLGIAGQQVLANFFAGVVLLAVHPVSVGDHVVLRSGPLGGEYEGHVTDMSLFYVDLQTPSGPVKLPNSGVLASAIGPGARVPSDEQPRPERQEVDPAEGGPPPRGAT